eukprot:CAMPEP_0178969252 /NCGR_PEP_ID=MMETSP0789-20121207/18743_1 /TAXON_ID=3005 /ORGANISM="Rhizosolenia setigera, Strain CCMP 1694" /LENGTH=94 /DNA_ID=CAMNT_0020655345 /DNA_START=74 /DNA_END=358 /DNA_ORIENTATION=+
MKSPALLLFALALTLVAAKEPTYLRTVDETSSLNGDGVVSVLKRQMQIFGECDDCATETDDAASSDDASASPSMAPSEGDDSATAGADNDGNTF